MTDRRSLIAGLALTPIVFAMPCAAHASTSAWDMVMSEYLAARKASDASPFDDELCDAMVEAESKLLSLPGPHIRAVEWKLSCLQDIADGCVITPEAIGRVLADVRRLVARG